MDLVRHDWKHILRNETSQKSLFKTFCCNYKGTSKTSKNFPIRKSTLPSNQITLNTSNHVHSMSKANYPMPQVQRTRYVSSPFYSPLQAVSLKLRYTTLVN